MVKNLPANLGDSEDLGSIPGLRRSPGGGNGNSSIPAWRIPWTRSLAGHSPCSRQESDTTEHTRQTDKTINKPLKLGLLCLLTCFQIVEYPTGERGEYISSARSWQTLPWSGDQGQHHQGYVTMTACSLDTRW